MAVRNPHGRMPISPQPIFDKKIHPIVFQWFGHFLWAGTRPAPANRNQVRNIGEAEIFIIFQIRVRRKKKKITMNQLNEICFSHGLKRFERLLRDGAWRIGREATIGREGADMDARGPALTTNRQGRPPWPSATRMAE